jgi:hypothetical protein
VDRPPEHHEVCTVVLVEGVSDHTAVTTLARLRGRDLAADGVHVVAMGGATNISRFLLRYGDQRTRPRLAGLCDVAEVGYYRRGLERAGLGAGLTLESMGRLGFFACARDLEDELIRCLGADAVCEVVEQQGESTAFRVFQKQPAQRGKPVEDQLHRFLGTHSGRKARYARALVEALPHQAPLPLERLLRATQ